MSTHRRRRLNRNSAEVLLRGRPVGPLADGDALAGLLAAAAARARDAELAGEEHAVTAFRAANLVPATQPRRTSMIKTGIARLLTLKVALAAGVTAAGGLALAAGTGHLPSQLGGSSTPAAHASANAGKASEAKSHHPNASPSPSLVGLCHAFTAGVSTNPGKALDNPAFTALITAAGGKSNVASFCAAMLQAKASHAPSVTPTGRSASHHGKPSTHPTSKATTHPTGPPTTRPTH